MNEALKTWRFNAGLTVAQAAATFGVSSTQWRNWESLGVVPHPRNAKMVADRIGLRPAEIWPAAVGQ